jgi:predicted RNA binding protein YcfA (HicA-like mRNA interferase family)
MKITLVVHEAKAGGFWGDVPAMPRCASRDETPDELMAKMHKPSAGCLWREAAAPHPGGSGAHPRIPRMKERAGRRFACPLRRHGWQLRRINRSHHTYATFKEHRPIVGPPSAELPAQTGIAASLDKACRDY